MEEGGFITLGVLPSPSQGTFGVYKRRKYEFALVVISSGGGGGAEWERRSVTNLI